MTNIWPVDFPANREYRKFYAALHHPKGIGFFISDKAAFDFLSDAYCLRTQGEKNQKQRCQI